MSVAGHQVAGTFTDKPATPALAPRASSAASA
jgi:hypothetical protein